MSAFGYCRIWDRTVRKYLNPRENPEAETCVRRYSGDKLTNFDIDKDPRDFVLPEAAWQPSWRRRVQFADVYYERTGDQWANRDELSRGVVYYVYASYLILVLFRCYRSGPELKPEFSDVGWKFE